MAEWAELPIDILGLLVQRLDLVEDYHRFRIVCKSWRSLTPTEGKPKFSLKFPSLMLDETYQEQKEGSLEPHRQKFYSQLTSQIYEINLPEASRKICMGVCSGGWILTLGLDDFQIDLLSPFMRRRFRLPSMLHFKDQYEYDEELEPKDVVNMFVKKVVASVSPEQENCILVAIYGEFRRLAFARLGDELWTNINVSTNVFDDILYYKGEFYAVNRLGAVFVCDLHHKDGPTTIKVARCLLHLRIEDYIDQKYLVESCGDLYILSRERGGHLFSEEWPPEKEESESKYFTVKFYVRRLVRDDSYKYPYRLEAVNDLGDRAIFLGRNATTSISSSECVRANCVYFSDDNVELWCEKLGGGHDTGIFDMRTGEIERCNVSQQFKSKSSPPFWYL